MTSTFDPTKGTTRHMTAVHGKVRALPDDIIVEAMQFGERVTNSGIVVLGDDGKDRGIRPRWAKVHSVGDRINYLKPGDWIYIEHGRWTRGFENIGLDDELRTLRKVDTTKILAIYTGEGSPEDEAVGLL